MREWTDRLNSFNSMKILFHVEKLRAIVSGKFKAPVIVDTDPSNLCNQNCKYCNSKHFRNKIKSKHQPPGHLLNLAKFYRDWGVQSVCIGGGGEPFLNPEVIEMIPKLYEYGLESVVNSNGVLLEGEAAEAVVSFCKFIGVSFDGACKKTYEFVRGADDFDKVVKNILGMTKLRDQLKVKTEVNMKYLVHPWAYKETYEAIKLAKNLGCNLIHIRPCGLENLWGSKGFENFSMEEYISTFDEQTERAFQDLEDENFKIYSVRHKFGKNMEKVVRFNKCLATPLNAVFGADGYIHLCPNMRGRDDFQLVRHDQGFDKVLRAWGSKKHKELISKIEPKKCFRCTYQVYNEVIEKCIIEDNMCSKFI